MLIPLVVIVCFIAFFIKCYNGLIRLRNHVKNAWAQIDVQLKRRWDLIPNLMETVKDYMSFEQETLENVTKARNVAMGAAGQGAKAAGEAEAGLSRALAGMYVVMENYPDLKANTNVMALQEELTSTENKISFARQFYNDTVMRFNTKLQTIPTNVIGALFNFKEEEYFELTDAEMREAPKVNLR
ncbi:LemA family protein [Planctomycetota bacterium]